MLSKIEQFEFNRLRAWFPMMQSVDQILTEAVRKETYYERTGNTFSKQDSEKLFRLAELMERSEGFTTTQLKK